MFTYPTDAACRDADPAVFFPVQLRDAAWAPVSRPQDAAEALGYCRGCPVLAECRARALGAAWGYGVFGGLTADQRARILRARHRTSPAEAA